MSSDQTPQSDNKTDHSKNYKQVYDPIYGFIRINPLEWEIIHSPFYQRLRWIKQLGFSFYMFPGAEHSRYGHSIGVMYNAHKIVQSIGIGVKTEQLMDVNDNSPEALFHKSLRVAALMHDLGTFPFSHTIEMSYIKFAETTHQKGGKGLKDDHENLGSFIIKNTDYEGGITHILKKYGMDPQFISNLVKGVDSSVIANQILHSEIDCDRMDYLLRDAHYTGLRYGSYDRDYLLYHFRMRKVDNHRILTINENALHCVEDFLMSRYAWYSQVVRSPRGAKYDAIAEHIGHYMLEKGMMYRYSQLLEMISKNAEEFFGFNDTYFMGLVHKHYIAGDFNKNPKIKDMVEALLFQKGARVIRSKELSRSLLDQDKVAHNEKLYKKAEQKIEEIRKFLDKHGGETDWLISDLPQKDISFVKSHNSIIKGKTTENVLLERDPVKISYENGDVKLLAEVENSVISILQNSKNFLPNAFCSNSAYELLLREGLIEEDR